MAQEYLISKAKLDELEKELDYLKSVKRQEMAAVIKEALSHGDLSENSEYDEAKNSQAIMEAHITELEKMLQNARVIDEDSITTDHVVIGVRAKVLFVDDNEEETYEIVSSGEADAMKNKISDESPLGAALVGHKAGEDVVAETPGGELRIRILEISKMDF
ncbi:MAG: transcription elongation factor GreA [Oscillospiraceae bacterium]|nr:transcription elongation factor GreA [Oscillospiraceae bacterium]